MNVHGEEPPGGQVVRHQVYAVPVAQEVSAAHDGQGLMAAHLGGGHLDAHVAAGARLLAGMPEGAAVGTAEHHLAEGGAVEGRIVRTFHPAGADDDILSGGMVGIKMLPPLPFYHLSVADQLEGETVSVVDIAAGEHDLPELSEGRLHRDAALAHTELNALAPGGTVMNLDICGHSLCVSCTNVTILGRFPTLPPSVFLPNCTDIATNEQKFVFLWPIWKPP